MTRTLLLLNLANISCSAGWSVGGYQLTPADTSKVNNTVFIEIIAQDSTLHWYANTIYSGDNWCHLHDKWEEVKVK